MYYTYPIMYRAIARVVVKQLTEATSSKWHYIEMPEFDMATGEMLGCKIRIYSDTHSHTFDMPPDNPVGVPFVSYMRGVILDELQAGKEPSA